MSKQLRKFFGVALAALALSGCVSQSDVVADRGTLLSAAGFVPRPANTPERIQSLRSLPPGQVVQQPRGDEFIYVMADPVVCNCLYSGDSAAYGRYQQELFQRHISEQYVLAAQLNQDSAFSWSPWGPFGVRGPGYF